MSERLQTCKALAALIREGGEKPSVDELRFVAHVALELGLTEKENGEVQEVLESGGSFKELIGSVNDRGMQLFLFRQVVAAALIDEHINDDEHAYINTAAETFKIPDALRGAFVAWMHEGMEWEKRGAALMAAMST